MQIGWVHRHAAALLALLAIPLSESHAWAQDIEPEFNTQFDVSKVSPNVRDDGKPHLLAVPIPVSNPTFGSGLAAIAALIYRIDKDSPPSYSGIGGVYTSSSSWGVGVAQSSYFSADRYRINAGAIYGNLNYDFYGVGTAAGSAARSIEINQTAYGGGIQAAMRVWHRLYAGLQAWGLSIGTSLALEQINQRFPDLVPLRLGEVTYGLGPVIDYDTRNDRFFPTQGMLASLQFSQAWVHYNARNTIGADYQKLGLSFNYYWGLSTKDTLAFRASGCSVWGNAPAFNLCLFGTSNDLRGYVGGQYRDRKMFAVQGEYRRLLFWRIGGAIFGGFGAVSPSVSQFKFEDFLPSYGAGLRFRVSEEYGVNFAIDYARGKDSDAVYFRVGEAF